MVKTIRTTICKHCKKEIRGKAKLVGLTFICPHCEKPSEDVKLGESVRVKKSNISKLRAEMNYYPLP